MYNYITLENTAIFRKFSWQNHTGVNIIIGKNDTGKTHLLKILYSIAKSLENYAKQQSQPPAFQEAFNGILSRKLLWTFQPEGAKGLAELISKGQKKLRVEVEFKQQNIYFSFGEDTRQQIKDISSEPPLIDSLNVVFIPAKEILTALDAIAATREKLEIFGFDDTYYDLITALRLPNTKGNIHNDIKKACDILEKSLEGKIIRRKDKFIFQKGKEQFTMSQVAEGVKKIGIITTLVRNRSLQKGSILFLDEPESNLHPEAILKLVEVLFFLSKAEIQIYVATHSYLVIKQFEILARKYQEDMCICSIEKEEGQIIYKFDNLRDGLPSNPIIEASINLYDQDLEMGLN